MAEEIEQILAEIEKLNEAGNIQAALARCNDGLQLTQDRQPGDDIRARLLIERGSLLAYLGSYDAICAVIDDLQAPGVPDWAAAEGLIFQGIRAAAHDVEEAEALFIDALESSRQAGYRMGIGRAMQALAEYVHFIKGQFNLAVSEMEEAVRLQKQAGGRQEGALITMQAQAAWISGDRTAMRHYLDEMLPLVRPATHIAGVYYLLWACLSLDENESEKAEEYLRLCFRIATATGNPWLNVMVRLQYCRSFRLKEHPADAIHWAEDAVRQGKKNGITYLTGMAMTELAQACLEAGDDESAEQNLLEATEIHEKLGASYHLAKSLFLLANLYHNIPDPRQDHIWIRAAGQMIRGGYEFILEQERSAAFPVLAYHIRSRDRLCQETAENLLEHLAKVPPPPLKVNALGGFSVWQGRRKIPDSAWTRRKAGELFRYLLLKPLHSAAREEVFEDIWPDSSPIAAQDLFHQATSTLRHALEPDLPDKFPSRYLTIEGDRVCLHLPSGSSVDFEQFELTMPDAINAMSTESLKRGLGLYTGELYPMDRYQEWSVTRRNQISELYLRGMLALGYACMKQGQFYPALQCARKVIQLDAWSEDAVFLGMQAMVRLRDIPHALQIYMDLVDILDRDLKIQPRTDLRELAEQLRQTPPSN